MSIRTFAAALAALAVPAIASAEPLAAGSAAFGKQFPSIKAGLRELPLASDRQRTFGQDEQLAEDIQAADQDPPAEGRENGRKPKDTGGKAAADNISQPGADGVASPAVGAFDPAGKATLDAFGPADARPDRVFDGRAAEGSKSARNRAGGFVPVAGESRPVDKPRNGRPGRRHADETFPQGNMPSALQIERQLEAAPRLRVRPEERVTIREFKTRPDLRRNAPAIDIQSINFAFGSAEIPYSQYGKIENIAEAIDGLLRRDRRHVFLIEGHTDAVGSWGSNLRLSEARAASLKDVLVNEFGIPRRSLETVGYGEEFLLVPTQNEDWRNRRVTLRRITEQVVPF